MREVFQNELDSLADMLVEMTQKVSVAMEKSKEALRTNDLELAEEVIAADVEIDRLQLELDKSAAEILALQAPVARDLRVVIATLRMSASIERMGDLARHVSQQVRIRFPESAVPDDFRQVLKDMTTAAVRIAHAIQELVSEPGLDAVPTIDDLDEDRRLEPEPVAGRGRHPALPLPRALRRPRGLDRPAHRVPADRVVDIGAHPRHRLIGPADRRSLRLCPARQHRTEARSRMIRERASA
jgi:phosphate transport system protein